MTFSKTALLLTLLAAVCISSTLADDADLIVNLPGLPDSLSNLNMYSGLVTVNQTHGRQLFYFFVESQGTPSKDPLVAFLNGGPGCSSLGGGMMSECGPFYPDANGNLQENPHSWNKISNFLVVESPSGVGFSISNTTSDYTTGDSQTAADWLQFLLIFLQKFPQYANTDFYISGESYGGHYVPQLAKAILDSNKAGVNPKINLKGYLVGNPWTDAYNDNYYTAFAWYARTLNSLDTWNGMATYCDFSNIGPLANKYSNVNVDPLKCQKYVTASTNEMGNINIYEIYQDVCLSTPDGRVGSRNKHAIHLLKTLAGAPDEELTVLGHVGRTIIEKEMKAKLSPQKRSDSDPFIDPCIDNYVETYLNRPDVQASIHAPKLSYQWSDCSGIVNYSYKDLLTSVLPTVLELTKSGIRIMMYTGDHDGIISSVATEHNVLALNLTVAEPWRPWLAINQQVGGYVTRFNGLTFATVRGAGHMVPYIQPLRAYDMFSRFVGGHPL